MVVHMMVMMWLLLLLFDLFLVIHQNELSIAIHDLISPRVMMVQICRAISSNKLNLITHAIDHGVLSIGLSSVEDTSAELASSILSSLIDNGHVLEVMDVKSLQLPAQICLVFQDI